MDYMPLHTYDYKIAFCQATNGLCEDVQRIIWNKANKYETHDFVCPGTPKKIREKENSQFPTKRFEMLVRKWREKWGEPDGF